jgi:formate hydrogenlyase transcriptional activator
VPVDVRIVAATNADLAEAIKKGTFRADLFYRLHVFPVSVPPLRERREDIPVLAAHFLSLAAAKLKKRPLTLDPASLQRLVHYDWPGNVRELQSLIDRAVILSRSEIVVIDEAFFPKLETRPVASSPGATAMTLEQLERQHILSVLELTGWRVYGPQGAAAQLGLNPETLRSKLRKLGLKKSSRVC